MPAEYTPFLSNIGKTIGQGITQRDQGKLIQSAYMGDQGALQQLYAVNPQAAQQIESGKAKKEQQTLEATRYAEEKGVSAEDRKRKIMTENKALVEDTMKKAAKLGTLEEANAYVGQVVDQNAELFKGIDVSLTPESFSQIKKVYGAEGKEGFAGTGMEAQVSNMLVKGAEDPEFRKTPEYARAWQLANEPKIIRTPTGDIKLPPEVPSVFKKPGEPEKPEKRQLDLIINRAEKDAEIITKQTEKEDDPVYVPGTERAEKYTEGEKKSAGFYERMSRVEDDIESLGTFDPTAWAEIAKGVTNITASEKMQLYRQSASDWIRAKLRFESGAVIAEEEMDQEFKTYFPVLGDTQAVIKQKAKAREVAVESMRKNAGALIKEAEKEKPTEKAGAPTAGDIVEGFRFKGGDPSKQENWEPQ